MNAFECYKSYLALKNHFTKEGYDYHKYNGKVSASKQSFESRRDRYYFEKLARKRDTFGFLLANLVENPKTWAGELTSSDTAEKTYVSWSKRNQSLSYTFREELSNLSNQYQDFDDLFKAEQGSHPPLLKEYMREKVSLETMIILLHLTKAFGKWQKNMEYDPVWRTLSLKVRKYQPFMKYDLDKFRKIVIDIFS